MVSLFHDAGAPHGMMIKWVMQLSHDVRQKAGTFQFRDKVAGGKKKDILGGYKALNATSKINLMVQKLADCHCNWRLAYKKTVLCTINSGLLHMVDTAICGGRQYQQVQKGTRQINGQDVLGETHEPSNTTVALALAWLFYQWLVLPAGLSRGSHLGSHSGFLRCPEKASLVREGLGLSFMLALKTRLLCLPGSGTVVSA